MAQLGKGGGKPPTSPPPASGGGGRSNPPATPPPSGGGGGRSNPPVSQPPTSGGGGSRPPVSPPPPVGPPQQGGGGGLGKGGGSTPPGQGGGRSNPPVSQPPTRGGGNSGGQGSGGLGKGGGSTPPGQGGGRSNPPVSQPPTRGGGNNGGFGQGQGGQGSGGGLGRIDNPTNRGGRSIDHGAPAGRGNDRGRTGSAGYGTTNNQFDRALGRPENISRLPELTKGGLQNQALRLPEAQRSYSNYRSGYCQYRRDWNDDCFYYSYYSFNPWENRCTTSPWYLYPNLPGYISYSRIVYIANTNCQWGYGEQYRWNDPYGWYNTRSSNRDLDYAIQDLRSAFEDEDRRALGRLVPRSGRVNIYQDGRYSYSLNADDFYDLMMDNISGTRTTRYEITDVRSYRDGAQVSARHTFEDPWGRRTSVCHTYQLTQDRWGYTITDFDAGSRRPW